MKHIILPIILVLIMLLAGLFATNQINQSDAIPVVQTPVTEIVQPIVKNSFVQLSSHKSAESAKRAIKVHGIELKGLISASKLEVYKITIKGTEWYRVLLPMTDRKEADTLCSLIKAKGYDCLTFSA